MLFVEVSFESMVVEADRIPRDLLEVVVPEVAWRFQFRSGNRVAREPNERLHDLWRQVVAEE